MKTLIEIQNELNAPIPRSAVSSREGGNGRSLSYLAGHYVIARLNEVFGSLNWASDIKSLQLVHSGSVEGRSGASHSVHYIAQVRLVVSGPDGAATEHTDVGYGDGSDRSNPGKAHELAVKEAVTDALKRCAKNLGMSMGLALYDKDQPNVSDERAEAPPKPSAQPLPRPVISPVIAAPKASPVGDDKQAALNLISATSKVLVSIGKATVPLLKAELRNRYGTENKDELSEAQAKEYADHLTALSKS